MRIHKLASFSDGEQGGNPAGVVVEDHHPTESEMQAIAAEVGYSETTFAAPQGEGYRVRYFTPEAEVAFCGHATIALGATLAQLRGDGTFALQLNETAITVDGRCDDNGMWAALQSPATRSSSISDEAVAEALKLLGYTQDDLAPELPPGLAHGGMNHLVLGLNSREALSAMEYDAETGRRLMTQHGWASISLVFAESSQQFHARNACAAVGIYEDPATGAATAALAGYLRDIEWPHGGSIKIVQGEDMGMRSLITAEFSDEPGSSIRVSGAVRVIE